jgi:prepilin-type N-terminal cleavage/methylation domain-containing protein
MNTHNRPHHGFTLMEIMVVVIVISVLASVAGPMVTSLADQGRVSATKAKMQNIRSAIIALKSDCGRYPFVGPANQGRTNTFYDYADNYLLGTTDGTNILANAWATSAGYGNHIHQYQKKWKGPYMDSSPEDFQQDSWVEKIKWFHHNKGLWLRSRGIDQVDDGKGNAGLPSYGQTEGQDDLHVSVARVTF